MKHLRTTLFAALLAPALLAQAPQPTVKLDADALSGLRARAIGPAVMSGRISCITGYMDQGRLTLYVGAASGGVWKSVNAGTTWQPVFDKHIQSIGAIAVDPSNPKTVWVGTGESWMRNSVSVGDGIYKSVDGGDSWTRMGLPDSEHIAAIQVDPTDSSVVYVAATGHLWSPGGDRGLYKTTDGGKTWKRILYTNEDSGCAAVAVDPRNPKVVFASLWQHRRTGWSFESGGPGSGLYKSTDGGSTWTRLTGDPKTGLPTGEVGRIAVAIAPSDSRQVYAVVEAKDGAIFHSSDGGATWVRGNAGPNIIVRPFYFSQVMVDPKNPLRVYKPGFEFSASDDGGKSFATIGGSVHSDLHALFFDPNDPEHMYLGTDGGVFVSSDAGNTWSMIPNLPVGQFYHVSTDSARPYHVYGGLQDNSCWMGYSRVYLSNKHWKNLFGGDGFYTFPDPTNERYVYAESQGGMLARLDSKTLQGRLIKPEEKAGDPKYRWNWNTPVALSPNEKGTLYIGCQFLFRSRDHGLSWERISPDLTTNNPEMQNQEESGGLTVDNSSAETHTTIFTISESPKKAGVIWAGTDDGNLQLTRNGGKTWENVASRVPGLPKGTWVSWVEASPYEAGTAFATFDGHTTGDMKPYVYVTRDFGQTWTSLATPDLAGFANVVKQDPVRPGLLYLGTENGLFISIDGGHDWARFKGGRFPEVPVRDMAFQPQEADLVIATHGRGLWVIDDLTSLRALTPEILQKDVAFLPTRPYVSLEQRSDGWMSGDTDYAGEDAPHGPVIAYWMKKRHMIGEMKIEILDDKGQVLQNIGASKARGFNRLTWNRLLRAPRAALGANPEGMVGSGPEALAGTYTVRLTKNKDVITEPLVIRDDPQSATTPKEREAIFQARMEMFHMIEDLAFHVEQVTDLQAQLRTRAASADPALKASLTALATDLETQRGRMVSTREANGAITGEERLREHLHQLYNFTGFQSGPPSPNQLARIASLRQEATGIYQAVDHVVAQSLPALNAALAHAHGQPLQTLTRAAWDQRTLQN